MEKKYFDSNSYKLSLLEFINIDILSYNINDLIRLNLVKRNFCIICGEKHQYSSLITCIDCTKNEEKYLKEIIEKEIKQIKKEVVVAEKEDLVIVVDKFFTKLENIQTEKFFDKFEMLMNKLKDK